MEQNDGTVGKWNRRLRAIGFVLTLLVFAHIGTGILSLFGLFIPLDKHFQSIMLFSLPITMALFLLHEAVFKNSFGKFFMSLKPVDNLGTEISFLQALKRNLLLGLWPVEALVLLFSKKKQRLGDRWAGTRVVKSDTPKRYRVLRVLIAIAAVMLLSKAANFTMGIASKNTSIYGTSLSYLNNNAELKKHFDDTFTVYSIPQSVEMLNDDARVVHPISFDGKKSFIEVLLKKKDGTWFVTDTKEYDGYTGRNYSFQQVRQL
jgi:uncharacterized RDD family membrane protein YckC